MKLTSRAPHTLSFWGLMGFLLLSVLGWLDSRWNHASDTKKTFGLLGMAVALIWTLAVWPLSGFSPWAGAKWAGRMAGKAACWPIQKAVACCVPGLRVPAETTAFFQLTAKDCEGFDGSGDTKPSPHAIVLTKDFESPEYRVSPKLNYDEEAPCGRQYSPSYDKTMRVEVLRAETEYYLHVRGGRYERIQVTKATWDKVQVGDVVASCASHEDGVVESHKEDYFAEFGYPNYLAKTIEEENIWAQMAKSTAAMMNRGSAVECREDQARRKRLREDDSLDHIGQD